MKDLSFQEIGDRLLIAQNKTEIVSVFEVSLPTLIWLKKKKTKHTISRPIVLHSSVLVLCDLPVSAVFLYLKSKFECFVLLFPEFLFDRISFVFPLFRHKDKSKRKGGWLALIPTQRRSLISNPSESATGLWRFKKQQTKINGMALCSALIKVTQLGNEIRLRRFSFSFTSLFRTEMETQKKGDWISWNGAV